MMIEYCDDCKHLSITEEEQNKLTPKPDHICLKLNMRIKHFDSHPRLPKPAECNE